MNEIAGYRIVRTLGVGARATVYLGRGAEPATALVALKVYHESAEPESIDREVRSLTGGASEHLVSLLDVAQLPGRDPGTGTVLVLERPSAGSLVRLLRHRGHLDAGEAITVLAPLYRAVAALHRAGFAHGAISPQQVLFDEHGRPVLIGLGHAVPLPERDEDRLKPSRLKPSRLRLDAAMAADYARLALLAGLVLGRGNPAAAALLEGVGAVGEDTWVDEAEDFAERFFRLARPCPVRFDARVQDDAPALRGLGAPPRPARSSRLERVLHVVDAGPVRMLRARILAWMKPKRGLLIVAGSVSAALLVVTSAALPSPSRPAPTAAPTAVESPAPSSAALPSALAADDPIAAARALLELRAACLEHTDPGCLAASDQAGSGILELDRERLAPLYRGAHATLIQRSGDSALMSIRPATGQERPATVLMIKTGSGWRLRDLFRGS